MIPAYLAPPPERQARPGKAVSFPVVAGMLAAVIAGWWLIGRIAPGELVQPLGPDLMAAAVFVGVLAGLLLVVRMVTVAPRLDGRGGRRRIDALIGAAVLPMLLATACLRLGLQAVAFLGAAPPAVPAAFTVTGTGVSRGSPYLRVRLGAGGRTFSVPVGYTLYEAARADDTVALQVQTGRFGLQRALLAPRPTLTDLRHPAGDPLAP